MGHTTPLGYVSLTIVLVTTVMLAADSSIIQFSFSDQARAASENELEISCENNQDLCLVEACLGNGCSNVASELGISRTILSGSEEICQTGDEEINSFNFRAAANEPDEIGADSNLAKLDQVPSAWWDSSDSDILIGMDLGMIKRICDIDIKLNDKADIENGFLVTLSNASKHSTVASESGGTFQLDSTWQPALNDIAGRFVYLTIPGVSEFYIDDDEDKPLVSEIKINALSTRNSVAQSNQADGVTKQPMPNNVTAQLRVSPLEFLNAGADLLNTPTFGPEQQQRINHSSSTVKSSSPTPSMYTGDILLP